MNIVSDDVTPDLFCFFATGKNSLAKGNLTTTIFLTLKRALSASVNLMLSIADEHVACTLTR